MNQIEALRDTIELARVRTDPGGDAYVDSLDESGPCSFEHLQSMLSRIEKVGSNEEFSPTKIGRWLGYVQGVLIARDIMSLDEAKTINKSWAD